MAVYTNISQKELEELLKQYNLGNLINFEGISEGVENTNFKITTTANNFILTIFEKRVAVEELPFFVELMNHLSKKEYKCPIPISDIKGEHIIKIKNKLGIIVSFVNGNWVKKIENIHCKQLGNYLALLHLATKDFKLKRKNSMGNNNWGKIFNKFRSKKKDIYGYIFDEINKELSVLQKEWPRNLPSGVIHADLFQDNVFFENDKFSGIIDFYFACNDYYAYELAICLNAWCFESDQSFNTTKARLILNNYQNYRPLSNDEKNSFHILARGAALRFLLTRLNDIIFHPPDAIVRPKDPTEYLKILNFHRHIKSTKDYGLED